MFLGLSLPRPTPGPASYRLARRVACPDGGPRGLYVTAGGDAPPRRPGGAATAIVPIRDLARGRAVWRAMNLAN